MLYRQPPTQLNPLYMRKNSKTRFPFCQTQIKDRTDYCLFTLVASVSCFQNKNAVWKSRLELINLQN